MSQLHGQTPPPAREQVPDACARSIFSRTLLKFQCANQLWLGGACQNPCASVELPAKRWHDRSVRQSCWHSAGTARTCKLRRGRHTQSKLVARAKPRTLGCAKVWLTSIRQAGTGHDRGHANRASLFVAIHRRTRD
eukprot:SAG11_NODE_673_length_7803_cov_58.625000_1_plen_136_part_00